ncbi:MAG: hypothetical protein ACE5MH_05385, partial [Terriglobia bacterium]
EAERRALLAKYGLLRPPAAGPGRQRAAKGRSDAPAQQRRSQAQGRGTADNDHESREARRARWRARRAARAGARNSGEQALGPRPDAAKAREGEWQIVWKLNANDSLQPVRIKTGITDYTFTAMLEGKLKPGDKLVIGEISPQGQSSRRLRRMMRRF